MLQECLILFPYITVGWITKGSEMRHRADRVLGGMILPTISL